MTKSDTTKNEKLAKLPKWAQSEILVLRMNVANLEKHIASLFTQKQTNVEYDPFRRDGDRLFLPDNSHISFSLDGGSVQVRIERGRLNVMGDCRFENDLNVMPTSANTLTIGFGEPLWRKKQ